MRPRWSVYLSPHLDDAVLSCGGHLWTEAADGAAPRVITVFSGIVAYDALTPFAHELHARSGDPPLLVELRRAEDGAAFARLGVLDVVHLDWADAIYRHAPDGSTPYDSDEGIFGAISAHEAGLETALADDIAGLLPAPGAGDVFAPLAVGGHVDHRLVYAAARLLQARGHRVRFYEDLPYAAKPGALDAALADKPDWTVETLALNEAALAAKVAGVSYHRSQIPTLFGDDLAMSRDLRAYAAQVAPPGSAYGERAWLPASV